MEALQFFAHLSTFFASIIAIYGIDAWRREHRAKRQTELAEETLALFYEASDAIRYMRNPASYASETDHVVRGPSEGDAAYHARKQASLVFKRYDDRKDVFNKLHALRYRFMAQIGKEQAKPFDELHDIVRKIQMAGSMLSRLWDYNTPRANQEEHARRVEEYEAIFWEGMPGDEIQARMDLCIASIERACRAVIEGKGTLFAQINAPLRLPSK